MHRHLARVRRLSPTRTRRSAGAYRPAVEVLEDRCLLTSYTVTTSLDVLNDTTAGEVTLRDVLTAISTQAVSGNAPAGTASNTVAFAIGTRGSVQTINATTALPVLTHQAFIDGWSQGGANYSGPPLIVLNGAGAGSGASGLELDAGSNGSTVRGLVIRQFGANGIEVNGASGTLITGDYLGTDAAGTAALGNAGDGVLLTNGARANTVGGRGAGAGNVISANGNGVELSGRGTSGNVVLGNLIGTDAHASVSLGNVNDGILIDQGAAANTIGGGAAGAANVLCGSLTTVPSISGSSSGQTGAVFSLGPASISGGIARFDVELAYTDTPSSSMVYLGIDLRANGDGVLAPDDSTGHPDFSAFNFLPSNILDTGWAPLESLFPGEFLYQTPPPPGTVPTSGLLPNATYLVGTLTYDLSKFGIAPDPSLTVSIEHRDTVIGTEQNDDNATFGYVNPTFLSGQQPIETGNATAGIEVRGDGTSGNAILGNLIGTSRSGTAALGHLTEGVLIDGGAAQNTVGGTSSPAANVIAGNDDGITLSDSGTSGNVVVGNRIGTDRKAVADLGNSLAGVLLQNGAASNRVGGTTAGSGNIIAFNGQGVVVGTSASDTGTIHDTILGNNIYGSRGQGIDLGNQAATTNSANPRAFPNDGQNAPAITVLTPTSVSGTLTSVPGTSFRIELFATPIGTRANHAAISLGAIKVTTNAKGTVAFTAAVASIPLGSVVTATATNLATGDTSAFSPVGTQLLLFPNPLVTSGSVPQVTTISAQLISSTRPVTAGRVTFTIVGLPGRVMGKTNANGVVTVQFVVPAGTQPGQYRVVATYLGDDVFPGSKAEDLLTILGGGAGRRWYR
jgi:hypothetical protein